MIQGQNNPIRVKIDESINFESIEVLSCLLYKGDKELKKWAREDVSYADGYMYLPLTEVETLAMPNGLSTLELKCLGDHENTLLWEKMTVPIFKRKDSTLITDGSAGNKEIETFVAELQTEIIKGLDGEDGKTPIRGVDYWTEADKEEIILDIQDLIGKIPKTVNHIAPDENGNIQIELGTVNYNDLENKPKINGKELIGDFKIDEYDDTALRNEIAKKVDKVTGKGLSTNDYTASAKAKVDAIPSNPKYTDTVYDDSAIRNEISKKVDKVSGKGLSTNDYTTSAKAKVDAIPSNPKYTDTVYDDTELRGRVSTLESATVKTVNHIQPDASGNVNVEGGSGTSDYNELENKPSINGTELVGDVTIESELSNATYDEETETISFETASGTFATKEELAEVNENLNDLDVKKVGYSEVIGSQLLMYSDSTKGHLLATLDLPSGGGSVDDVQVNGESIVTDGVANIPVGTNSSFGVFKTAASYGTTNVDGQIRINPASDAELINRNKNSVKPISGANLDYAVKSALCDCKGEAYTAEEQANARARLGIGWEKIAEITLEEETSIIKIDKDMNGEDIHCKEVYLLAEENPLSSGGSSPWLRLFPNPTYGSSSIPTGSNYITIRTAMTTTKMINGTMVSNIDGFNLALYGHGSTNASGRYLNTLVARNGTLQASEDDLGKEYTRFCLYAYNGTGVGSKFTLWGRN